jgi:hypothetical protein
MIGGSGRDQKYLRVPSSRIITEKAIRRSPAMVLIRTGTDALMI